MTKQIADFKLVEKQDYGRSVLLRLRYEQPLPDIAPGQFVQVRVDNSTSTYLRRPISIHDVDFQQNEIALLVQRVGDGTRHLAQAEKGVFIKISKAFIYEYNFCISETLFIIFSRRYEGLCISTLPPKFITKVIKASLGTALTVKEK